MSRGTRRQEAGLQAHCSDSPEQGASVSAGSRGRENKDSVGWGRERAGSVAQEGGERGCGTRGMGPWAGRRTDEAVGWAGEVSAGNGIVACVAETPLGLCMEGRLEDSKGKWEGRLRRLQFST